MTTRSIPIESPYIVGVITSMVLKLKMMWDEMGHNNAEQQVLLMQLEEECMDLYSKKVQKVENDFQDYLWQSVEEERKELRKAEEWAKLNPENIDEQDTHEEDAHQEDAHQEDAHQEDAHQEDAHQEQPELSLQKVRQMWMKTLGPLPVTHARSIYNPSPSNQKVFAIACEMVAVKVSGKQKNVHKAAHVCLVNSEGTVVYKTYISQKYPVHNYMTWISGMTSWKLRGAPSLKVVHQELYAILGGNILVGHCLQSSLTALEMMHPLGDRRNIQAFFEAHLPHGETQSNLKLMASVHLDREIQRHPPHDPIEDAGATMELYLLYRTHVDYFFEYRCD